MHLYTNQELSKNSCKVARVVNMNLGFMDWFFIIINEFKISSKNLDEALLFLGNQVFCHKKLKTLMCSIYHRVRYCLLKFCTRFLLTHGYKRMFGVFEM